MSKSSTSVIDFSAQLLRDGETFSVRYACVCGCRPQVKLRRESPAGHEHCCCGIAHAAGPDARTHMEGYLAERRAAGGDADRTYTVSESEVLDPWGQPVSVAYAIPEALAAHDHGEDDHEGGGRAPA